MFDLLSDFVRMEESKSKSKNQVHLDQDVKKTKQKTTKLKKIKGAAKYIRETSQALVIETNNENNSSLDDDSQKPRKTLAGKLSEMVNNAVPPSKPRLPTKKLVKHSTKSGRSRYFPPPPRWEAPPGYGPSSSWRPPSSPFHLFEEQYYWDPWRLLAGCIFLNKTSARVALPIFHEYLQRWPDPRAASLADQAEVSSLLRPMGLHRQRAATLARFSLDFLGPWSSPARDLHGVGKYGEDAWRLFCCGDTGVQPKDKELRRYLEWYRRESEEGACLNPALVL